MDLATTLTPDRVVRAAEAAGLRAVPTGIAHGTVTLLAGDETAEVTTLREDIETDGRHAIVRFGRDFKLDAERRDFTINALSLGLDGTLHDPAGGRADLAAARVRFIGDPDTRIREDALRVLRFFRFHARFGGEAPDPEGLAACIRARDGLARLSRERIRAELLKLLAAPGALAAVRVMSEAGLLQRLVGGIGDQGRLGRAIAAGLPEVSRLAALCVWNGDDAERLGESLRLSRAEQRVLLSYADALASLHGRDRIDGPDVRALLAMHGEAAVATLAVLEGEPRPRVSDGARGMLAQASAADSPRFPLAGADLVAGGVPPGPAVGRGLAAARALWLDLGCPEDLSARQTLLSKAFEAAKA